MTRQKNPPPTSNTGVEKKSISQNIDWLEVTFRANQQITWPDSLSLEGEQCNGFHGYTVGWKYTDGRILLSNPTRPDMGQHVIWSGESLRKTKMPALELVSFMLAAGASITRIDLAVDCIGYSLMASQATEEIKNGRYSTRAQKFPTWYDAKNAGYTQYIGTKASDIFARIYDKAAEMDATGDWTRVELSLKSKRAHGAARQIVDGVSHSALLLGFIRFPEWKEWNEAMADFAVTLPTEQKESKTKQWLLKQCAASLAKCMLEDGNDEFYFKFVDEVRFIVQKGRQ